MADIQTSTWSESAASNSAAPPDGAPENHARNKVNDIQRETMGAVKREWNRSHPTVTSAGTEPAFTLSYTTAPTYVQGIIFAFKAHATPSGSVTLNVNTLGAKKVYDFYGNAQLGSAAWPANARVIVSYDTALDGGSGGFVWLNQGYQATNGTVTSVAMTVPTGFSVSGSPVTTSGTLAVSLSNQTANTIWAGPSSGSAAAPTFRAMVAADKPAGSLIQSVATVTGAVATGSTTVPLDDTIPQNTEGDEYMTRAITPTSASNVLEIEVHWMGASTAGATAFMIAGLFQDTTANALAAAWAPTGASGQAIDIHFIHRMTAGTTSATTFKVRAGANGAGDTTFNGRVSGRQFGGVMASSIVIREIKA